ncbi:MAG TPA: glycosyl hydrolase family 18 protein [Chloroflexota bacterium]|nr:glycosyl hydrolase family 18 protein [Chloroflexota bacterium]
MPEIPRIDRRRMLQALLGAATVPLLDPPLAAARTASSSAPSRPVVFPWLSRHDSAGLASLTRHGAQMTALSPSWFDMGPDLTIGGSVEPEVLSIARQHNLALHPIIQNRAFDPKVAAHILATPSSRARAAGAIATLVLGHDFAGINLDFEGTFGASRDAYSDFVTRLADRLRPAGKWVTVDVVPQTRPLSSYAVTSWAAPFDFTALGQACNAVILMAYAYSGRSPGPISPLWWVKQVIAHARTQVPARSLVVGLPFYGLHWITNGGKTTMTDLTQDAALRLLAQSGAVLQRPPRDATPSFSWQDAQGQHVVHFEDQQSLTAKLCLVRAERIKGVAFWRLGREATSQWSAISGWSDSWV